jgi:hypothetical protein
MRVRLPQKHESLSPVGVMCSEVEFSTTDRSHFWRSSTECGLSDCVVSVCGVSECAVSECGVSECGVSECGVSECGVSECDVSECGVSECGVSECGVSECGVSESGVSECETRTSWWASCAIRVVVPKGKGYMEYIYLNKGNIWSVVGIDGTGTTIWSI